MIILKVIELEDVSFSDMQILITVCNRLTADDNYLLLNGDNLTESVQMQLSQKEKGLFWTFLCIFQIYLKFCKIFKKEMILIADVFPILRTPKNVVSYMSEKSFFRGPFDKQHGKPAKTLLQSERQHRYYIEWSFWREKSWKMSLVVIRKTL